MKIFEIKANCLSDAKAIAAQNGYPVVRNVTESFRKEQTTDYEGFGKKIFNKLGLTNASGISVLITVEHGSQDSRKQPWKYKNLHKVGRTKKIRMYVVTRTDTDSVVYKSESKKTALAYAKNAMASIKADMVCNRIYEIDEEMGQEFQLTYTPSVNAKQGTYVIISR